MTSQVEHPPEGQEYTSGDRGSVPSYEQVDPRAIQRRSPLSRTPQSQSQFRVERVLDTLPSHADVLPANREKPLKSTLHIIHEEEQAVWSMDVSPDGQFMVSVSADGTIRLWETGTWRLLYALPKSGDKPSSFCWEPEHYLLAYSNPSGAIEIWNYSTGKHLQKIETNLVIQVLGWGPQRDQLYTADEDGCIKLWDIHTGTLSEVLLGLEPSSRLFTINAKKTLLAVSEQRHAITVWTLQQKEVLARFILDTIDLCTLQFSTHSQELYAGCADGSIHTLDLVTQNLEELRTGHQGPVSCLTFQTQPDRWFASGGMDGSINLWDPTSTTPLQTLPGHKDALLSLCIDPAGKWLTSAGKDGTIRVWDTSMW